jgi:putative flippase GtrA
VKEARLPGRAPITLIFAAQALLAAPVMANVIGYSVGAIVSFILNRRFTFGASANRGAASRFLVVVGVSYLANLCTMLGILRLTGEAYVAQVCGVPVYILIGFFGNKHWALREKKTDGPHA